MKPVKAKQSTTSVQNKNMHCAMGLKPWVDQNAKKWD